MILFDTTPRIVGGLTDQWLATPSGNLTPPRISPSCPHCLSLWLDSEYRSTVSLRDSLPKLLWAGWVSLGHLSRPSFMRSFPHRWVLAHPPHRCSPSSGARWLTLSVAGYAVFNVHKKEGKFLLTCIGEDVRNNFGLFGKVFQYFFQVAENALPSFAQRGNRTTLFFAILRESFALKVESSDQVTVTLA